MDHAARLRTVGLGVCFAAMLAGAIAANVASAPDDASLPALPALPREGWVAQDTPDGQRWNYYVEAWGAMTWSDGGVRDAAILDERDRADQYADIHTRWRRLELVDGTLTVVADELARRLSEAEGSDVPFEPDGATRDFHRWRLVPQGAE